MTERLRRVAEVAPHGEINAMQTAELMLGAGVTKSKSRFNVDSVIHRRLKKSPDFRWVRRGWWRHIGPTAEADHETDGGREDEHWDEPTESGTEPTEGGEPRQQTQAEPEVSKRITMKWRSGRVDYGGSANLGDRLRAVLKHTADGVLEPGQVASRLLMDGQSTARPRNLERVVRRMLDDDPEFGELSPPSTGWYQYRPHPLAGPHPGQAHLWSLDDEVCPTKGYGKMDRPLEWSSFVDTICAGNGHTKGPKA